MSDARARQLCSSMIRLLKRALVAIVIMLVVLFAMARWNPVPAGKNTLRLTPERTIQHDGRLWNVTFSPDGSLVATATAEGKATLWRVADGAKVREFDNPKGTTWVVFSPDGQFLYASSYDSAVRKWRIADGSLVSTMAGHTGVVWSMAASADGKWLATGSDDKTIVLWD